MADLGLLAPAWIGGGGATSLGDLDEFGSVMPLGVDVGGTFTDVVLWDGDRLRVAKTSTTPADQSEGLVSGAQALAADGGTAERLVHGTTVATNALLERRGARSVLVTDSGFEDLIEIGRQDRPSLYDPNADRILPMVPRSRRLAVEGDGDDDLDRLAARCRELGAEAVIVGFVNAYLDDRAERGVANGLAVRLGVPVFASTGVVHEFREYERIATGSVNAFLAPEVDRYLARVRDRVRKHGLPDDITVMRSSGGLISIDAAIDLPVAILLSGPAGGVVATAALGAQLGLERLVSFDMGGTSTDVCLVEQGKPDVGYQRAVAGHPILMPSIAIHTVGAGGGSIGWADQGGALRVGPQSAGAVPGPAGYGRGGELPTVTDANVFLRRIDAGRRLADSVELHFDLAHSALSDLGRTVGLDPTETAEGVIRVVESHMSHAIQSVSVHQGTDPRHAHLVAFGGAGGLHAVALAKQLDMAGVVVPPYAGVFSALGLLLSPPRIDVSETVALGLGAFEAARSKAMSLAEEADRRLSEDTGTSAITINLIADLRYSGQSHETSVPLYQDDTLDRLAERFHGRHAKRNGFARPEDPVEIVTVRVEAIGRPALTWGDLPDWQTFGIAERGHRVVHGSHGEERAEVWWRPGLAVGQKIVGPAVVEEAEATTYLPTGSRIVVDESGALMISW